MHDRSPCRGAVASIFAAGVVAGPALAGAGFNAFGLDHGPLGAAQLSLDGGVLTVSNIGSSGLDGVRIDLGPSQGLTSEVDFGPAGGLRPGMAYWIDAFTPGPLALAGQDQKTLCARFQEVQGGLAALSLDVVFYDPTTIRVVASLGGQLQQTFEFEQPFPDPLVVSNIGSSGLDGVRLTISNIGSSGQDGVGPGGNVKIDGFLEIEVVNVADGSVGGNPSIQFDTLSISLDGLPAGTPVIPLNRIDMRAANPGATFELFVRDEALLLFDVPNRAVGQAHMTAGGDHLTISNIGSSGQDGVRQDPLPPGTQRGRHDLQFPDPLPSSYLIQITDGISVEGLPPGQPVVRTIELPLAAFQAQLTIDYTAIGSFSQTVQLSLSGALVFQQSGISGPLAEFSTLAALLPYDAYDRLLRWSAPTAVTIPGGPTILADELRVIPDQLTLGLPAFEQVDFHDIRLAGISTVHLALVFPPACPWDCGDGDGTIGIVDFLALLGQWSAAGSCDFDGGGVGITDFLELLGNWGACP